MMCGSMCCGSYICPATNSKVLQVMIFNCAQRDGRPARNTSSCSSTTLTSSSCINKALLNPGWLVYKTRRECQLVGELAQPH